MKLGLLIAVVGALAAAVTCGAAVAFGGRLERRAGVLVGLGWLASLVVQQVGPALDPNLAFLIIDGTVLLALIGLVWRAGRMWPLAAAGFQALATAIDAVRLTAPTMHAWVYLTGLGVAAYGLLGTLAYATIRSRRAGASA